STTLFRSDGNPVGDPVQAETDASGVLEVELCVPEDAEPGDFTVVGTDDATGTPAEAPLTVVTAAEQCESDPALTVTPSSVPAGGTVTVIGTGFPAGVAVTVQLTDADGNPVGDPVTVTPDEACGFTTEYTVPEDTEPGDYEVVAEPEDGGDGASTPITVEGEDLTPSVSVDPSEVLPGECTTVSGTGYTPDATVTVQLTDADGNPVGDPVTAETDADGAFTAELCVPDGTSPGDLVVVATDDTTGTPAEAPLTVAAAPSGDGDGDDPGDDPGRDPGTDPGANAGGDGGDGQRLRLRYEHGRQHRHRHRHRHRQRHRQRHRRPPRLDRRRPGHGPDGHAAAPRRGRGARPPSSGAGHGPADRVRADARRGLTCRAAGDPRPPHRSIAGQGAHPARHDALVPGRCASG